MKTATNLIDLLVRRRIPYEVISHPKCDRAFETAEIEHVPASQFAKVVMIKIEGKDAMFVIPANRNLDFFKVSDAVGNENIWLGEEGEFHDLFPNCEVGAMPPFGSLYHIPCYVDVALEDQKYIYFNAGSHKECIKMPVSQYLALAEAEIGDYSVPKFRTEA